jgi:radical SAM superfamily enzyme YgiQ (UPF0313 family)
MKEAGCDRVNYGIEHGSYEIRKNVLRRDMTDEVIIKAGRLFNKYNIRVQTANIIGVPHETVASVMRTIRLNRKVKPAIAQCFILQPYPGTEIYDYSQKHGFLKENYMYSQSGTGFQVGFEDLGENIQLELKDKKKLVKLYFLFNFLVKFRYMDPFVNILLNLPLIRLYKIIFVLPMIRQKIKFSTKWSDKLLAAKKLLHIIIKG